MENPSIVLFADKGLKQPIEHEDAFCISMDVGAHLTVACLITVIVKAPGLSALLANIEAPREKRDVVECSYVYCDID